MLVATAGHIDHGKTALVRALTGVETDHLPEEKRRGISIDLGFAYWHQPDGRMIGFVDVPGHERFSRTMLAGLCGIDAALLVVAADDGVMPQTVEHLQSLDLLGIGTGVVALTKCDRVELGRIQAVRNEIEELLCKTTLSGAPVHSVSMLTGKGIAELAGTISEWQVPDRHNSDHCFRLAIDRAFSVPGSGTVVTGTVMAGSVAIGDRVLISPRGIQTRVRGLQGAGRSLEKMVAGNRCALNLAGIELTQVRRGDWLVAPAMHAPTTGIAAEIVVQTAYLAPLRHTAGLQLHLGTANVAGKLLASRPGQIATGESALARIALERPVSAVVGDRFILRDPSGHHLIGGGRIVDPFTGPGRRRRETEQITAALSLFDPEKSLAALLAIPGHEVDCPAFARRFNLTDEAMQRLLSGAGAWRFGRYGDRAIASAKAMQISAWTITALKVFHAEHPDRGGLNPSDLRARLVEPISAEAFASLLRQLDKSGEVERGGALVRLPGHAPGFSTAEQALWRALGDWLETRGPQPFEVTDAMIELRQSEPVLHAALNRRLASGDLERFDERRLILHDHLKALIALATKLAEEWAPKGFDAASFRDASGIGRNMTIRILEYLDRIGVTVRKGDYRFLRGGHTHSHRIDGRAEQL